MDEQSLAALVQDLPVPAVRWFATTGSTNDAALEWINRGAQDGCLVAADTQTAGRGRLGRRWITEPGAGLAFSLVLRPQPWEAERLGLLSPLGALAVSWALEHDFGLQSEIKWPNDVLLGGRKVCGILLEAAWVGDSLRGVVIGIGLNVMRAAVPPAGQLLFPATSLEEVSAPAPERERLLKAILSAFFYWRARLASLDFLDAWQNRLAYRGQWVEVSGTGAPPVVGQVRGVAPGGDLRLALPAGEEILVSAGDVRLRPAGEG